MSLFPLPELMIGKTKAKAESVLFWIATRKIEDMPD